MSLSWTNLNAAAAVVWEKSNLRTMALMVDMPSVQTSLQRAWYCNLGGETWRFCAARLGSCWFKHKTVTVKQSPGKRCLAHTEQWKFRTIFRFYYQFKAEIILLVSVASFHCCETKDIQWGLYSQCGIPWLRREQKPSSLAKQNTDAAA